MGEQTSSEGGDESEPDSESEVGQAPGAGTESSPPSLDLAFEILKNERRRLVLDELSRADEPITTGDLSDIITARENNKSVPEITSEERKRVYVGLYQCHLPKMDAAGVISFDKDRGIIERGEHVDLLERYLEAGENTTAGVTTPAGGDVGDDLTTVDGPSGRHWGAAALGLGGLVVLATVVETVGGISTAMLALVALFLMTGLLAVRKVVADGR
jgi:hypothetical protein